MRDFKHFGVKRRFFPDRNYNAIWCNLKTIRLGEGKALELPSGESEFYDVGINTKCNAECPFCYVSATGKGVNYPNICETWKKWMATFWETKKKEITLTNKPFQIAIGSTGEPTIHPEFCEFLKTVYESGVVPNYTTNGITLALDSDLSEQLLDATRRYVGGVAVSFGNKSLRPYARRAIEKLIECGETKINIHHVISDMKSVDEFIQEWNSYENLILYHVLLPLMPSGRSTTGVEEGVWEYLEEMIQKNHIENVAFGAHFIKNLRTSKIKTWLYDEESFSKNIILTENKVQITPSSFNLQPIQIIQF